MVSNSDDTNRNIQARFGIEDALITPIGRDSMCIENLLQCRDWVEGHSAEYTEDPTGEINTEWVFHEFPYLKVQN